MTSNVPIVVGDKLSVGLSGVLTPGGTTGKLTLSSVLVGTGSWEMSVTNNTDADKIEYFQQ